MGKEAEVWAFPIAVHVVAALWSVATLQTAA